MPRTNNTNSTYTVNGTEMIRRRDHYLALVEEYGEFAAFNVLCDHRRRAAEARLQPVGDYLEVA